MFVGAGTILMVERATIGPGSLSFGRRSLEALVRWWCWLASEEGGKKVAGTGWRADIERRASVIVGRRALAVLEERWLAGEGAGDLIADRVRLALLDDRTGADDLVFPPRSPGDGPLMRPRPSLRRTAM